MGNASDDVMITVKFWGYFYFH